MKSKRSRKDRARRRKPFLSLSAMAAKRGVATIEIPHVSTAEFSKMFETEQKDQEAFYTEIINNFKISMGTPID